MRVKLDGFLSREFAGDLAPPMDLGLAPAAEYVSAKVDIVDARPLQPAPRPKPSFLANTVSSF
jgi:hypothetical protein